MVWIILISEDICEGVERQQFLDLQKRASESSGVSIRTHVAGKRRRSWALGVRYADTSETTWL